MTVPPLPANPAEIIEDLSDSPDSDSARTQSSCASSSRPSVGAGGSTISSSVGSVGCRARGSRRSSNEQNLLLPTAGAPPVARRCAPGKTCCCDGQRRSSLTVPRHFEMLYEDASVLVIDKPAGLPMHTTAKFWRNTLTALLRERYPNEHDGDRPSHRSRDLGRPADRAGSRGGELPHPGVRPARTSKDLSGPGEGTAARRRRHRQPLKLLDTPSHVMMGPPRAGKPACPPSPATASCGASPRHALCEATRRPAASTRSACTSRASATPSSATSSTAPARSCSCAPATKA